MKKTILFLTFVLFALLAGCHIKSGNDGQSFTSPYPTSSPTTEVGDAETIKNRIKTQKERLIYDVSATESEFIKTSFSWSFDGGAADRAVSVEYQTLTPGKTLLTGASVTGDTVEFTPAAGQGCGVASVTLHVGDDQKTVFIKFYDLSLKLLSIECDDGPSEFTEQILDTLNNAGINATFFVTGKMFHDMTKVNTGAEVYPETLKKEAALGHQIGNHTYNHPWKSTPDGIYPEGQTKGWEQYTDQEVYEQVTRLDDLLYSLVGFAPTYYSAPYGLNIFPSACGKTYSIYGGIVSGDDWMPETTKEQIVDIILSAPNDSVIIVHDVYQKTADAIKEVLASPSAKEIQFVTMDELDEVLQTR